MSYTLHFTFAHKLNKDNVYMYTYIHTYIRHYVYIHNSYIQCSLYTPLIFVYEHVYISMYECMYISYNSDNNVLVYINHVCKTTSA